VHTTTVKTTTALFHTARQIGTSPCRNLNINNKT
jgi:hypothetical protein